MYTATMGRDRTHKVMLNDDEMKLLKPLMDVTGMNRTASVVFLLRKYAKYEADNFQPK